MIPSIWYLANGDSKKKNQRFVGVGEPWRPRARHWGCLGQWNCPEWYDHGGDMPHSKRYDHGEDVLHSKWWYDHGGDVPYSKWYDHGGDVPHSNPKNLQHSHRCCCELGAVIMMCWCSLMSRHKWNTVVWVLDRRGSCACAWTWSGKPCLIFLWSSSCSKKYSLLNKTINWNHLGTTTGDLFYNNNNRNEKRKLLGMVAYAYNLRRLKQKDSEFEASLSYTVRFCFQT